MIPQRTIKVCEYKLHISTNVQDFATGEETGYTNSYKFCAKLNKRLTTRGCINCVFFKQKQPKPDLSKVNINLKRKL